MPPNQLLFFYQTGRNHKNPKKLLKRFNGVLQTDDYAVYETLDSKLPNLRLISCMAHIRRGFFEAKSNDENRANTALIFIQQLYKHHQVNPVEWLQDVLNRIVFTKTS